jgi:hypothetical protein
MRIEFKAALAAGLMVSACGGGQTEQTKTEEALFDNAQPTAPSPGTVDQPAQGGGGAPATGNSQ